MNKVVYLLWVHFVVLYVSSIIFCLFFSFKFFHSGYLTMIPRLWKVTQGGYVVF